MCYLIKHIRNCNFPNIHQVFNPISTSSLLFLEPTTNINLINLRKELKYYDDFNENNNYFTVGSKISSIEDTNYSYNKNLSIKSNSNMKEIINKMHEIPDILLLQSSKTKKTTSVIKEFPLNKKYYNDLLQIKTILVNFENQIRLVDIINSFNTLSNKETLSLSLEQKTIFLHSLTNISCLEDYSFETIETLGDTFLKSITSICLYYQDQYEKEGQLVTKRISIICNKHLSEIGNKNLLGTKCFSTSVSNILSNFDFPLLSNYESNNNNFIIESFTDKNIIDLVESIIGANGNISYLKAFKLILEYKILSTLKLENQLITKIEKSLDDISNVVISNKEILALKEKVNIDINIHDLFRINNRYNSRKSVLNFYKNFIDINDSKKKEAWCDICRVTNEYHLSNFEEIIGYTFKDKSLIIKAFTPRISDSKNNFERLEFLGDALIETFLVESFIKLLYFKEENPLYDDNNDNKNENNLKNTRMLMIANTLNPTLLTQIKSFFASNQFMSLLMIYYNFHEYIKLEKDNNLYKKDMIYNISKYYNSVVFQNHRLNNYLTSSVPTPKLISDCFEALIAAVYIDSQSISQTYKILNFFYYNAIVYGAKYYNQLKFSPIHELVEKCNEINLVCMFYCRKEKASDNYKEKLNMQFNYNSNDNNENKENEGKNKGNINNIENDYDSHSKYNHVITNNKSDFLFVVDCKLKLNFDHEDIKEKELSGVLNKKKVYNKKKKDIKIDSNLETNNTDNKEISKKLRMYLQSKEFIKKHNINLQDVFSTGISHSQDRAKEVCALNALSKYFS